MKKQIFMLMVLLALVASAFADCPSLYPNNQPILVKNSTELCNSFYVARYDNINKAVILSSELLVPGIGTVPRVTAFHSDVRVPAESRVKITDYTNTGYDRGHMASADDSLTSVDMYQSFLMTNMTPQVPYVNRVLWKNVEIKVRTMITRPTWVVTIATYDKFQTKLPTGVTVPTGYWKLVYADVPKAFYVSNSLNAIVLETTEDFGNILTMGLPK